MAVLTEAVVLAAAGTEIVGGEDVGIVVAATKEGVVALPLLIPLLLITAAAAAAGAGRAGDTDSSFIVIEEGVGITRLEFGRVEGAGMEELESRVDVPVEFATGIDNSLLTTAGIELITELVDCDDEDDGDKAGAIEGRAAIEEGTEAVATGLSADVTTAGVTTCVLTTGASTAGKVTVGAFRVGAVMTGTLTP